MSEFAKIIQYSTYSGQPIKKGNIVVTPISGVLRLNLPFSGFIWNRPVAVLIEEGENSKRLPIVDVTLLAQLALFGIGLSATVLTIVLSRMSKKRE